MMANQRLAIVLVLALGVSGVTAAQNHPDLSGYWELTYLDSQHVPRASLSPRVTKAVLDAQAAKDAKAVRWCNIVGMPAVMASPRPLDIRQTNRSLVIASEINAATRYIYLDRAAHISKDIFDATTSGDSIARWEGDTLVVDTIGFDGNKGLTAIPGGGFRTSNSHLVERFRLIENGSVLSIRSTWEDPGVYRTPHSYEFRYARLPRDYEARPPVACDPFDDTRTAFLTEKP